MVFSCVDSYQRTSSRSVGNPSPGSPSCSFDRIRCSARRSLARHIGGDSDSVASIWHAVVDHAERCTHLIALGEDVTVDGRALGRFNGLNGLDGLDGRDPAHLCYRKLTTMEPWSPERVAALAPDSASAAAGQSLANVRKWSALGRSDRAIWGLCQGSGKQPYQARVDLAEPAFKCSCPSRKFPCKHGLGLLLLFAKKADAFSRGDEPGLGRRLAR